MDVRKSGRALTRDEGATRIAATFAMLDAATAEKSLPANL